MNYYPDKYAKWKADHCDNSELDMNYLREEMNKTILQLEEYYWAISHKSHQGT